MPAPRVRFAPSPTGYLHVGGARTALFNWLFARHHGGVFVLRIEDTDVERSSAEMVEGILDGLRWLGLDWDEGPRIGGPYGPYFQSERLDRYRAMAQQLVDAGHAYYCYCTSEELEAKRAAAERAGSAWRYDRTCCRLAAADIAARESARTPRAIRFHVPEGATAFDDLVHGRIEFDAANIEDFVLLRSDGHPTYQLSVVADDVEMAITHVVRGDDHISNTPKQILLYRAIGAPVPQFAHVPLILGPDKKRLSKRHGATSVTEYARQGYLPEAMVNFLALLGWAFDGEREMFTMDELAEVFTLERVSKNPAIFNYEKLDWMNGEYFRALPLPVRADMVASYLRETGALPEAAFHDRRFLERAVEAVGDRMKRPRQFLEYAGYLFVDQVDPEAAPWAELVAKPMTAARLKKLAAILAEVDPFEHDAIEKATRGLAVSETVKAGEVIMPARIALTGKKVSPGIFDVMLLLGRERTVQRLRHAAERLEAGSPAPAS